MNQVNNINVQKFKLNTNINYYQLKIVKQNIFVLQFSIDKFKFLNEEIEIAYYLNLEITTSRILAKMGRSDCLKKERIYLGNCDSENLNDCLYIAAL